MHYVNIQLKNKNTLVFKEHFVDGEKIHTPYHLWQNYTHPTLSGKNTHTLPSLAKIHALTYLSEIHTQYLPCLKYTHPNLLVKNTRTLPSLSKILTQSCSLQIHSKRSTRNKLYIFTIKKE